MKKSGMKFLLAAFVLGIGLALILSACAPDSGFNTVADYDVVVTLYDESFNFTTVETYFLPDTIIHLGEEGDDNLSRIYDDFILNLVRENIEALGYVEADTNVTDPDVYFLIDASSTDYVGWSYWYDYWYWYPGWGGSYPYYPPGGWYPSYTFTTGSMFIRMFYEEDVDSDRIVWTAALNGLLGDTSTGLTSRLTNNINQAFDQSPYL